LATFFRIFLPVIGAYIRATAAPASAPENPVWVPADWHYIEEARKNGLRIVHLAPGQSIDAASGAPTAPHRETRLSFAEPQAR